MAGNKQTVELGSQISMRMKKTTHLDLFLTLQESRISKLQAYRKFSDSILSHNSQGIKFSRSMAVCSHIVVVLRNLGNDFDVSKA